MRLFENIRLILSLTSLLSLTVDTGEQAMVRSRTSNHIQKGILNSMSWFYIFNPSCQTRDSRGKSSWQKGSECSLPDFRVPRE